MTQHTKQQGFTLTELMIAMAFVSFILMFIVFAMVQVMGNYNKGVAVKEINQTARTLVEEITRLTRSTNSEAIKLNISEQRMCFGNVGYVWNIAGGSQNKYSDNQNVTMARVEDPSLCASGRPPVDKSKATVLLSNQVWVQDIQAQLAANGRLLDFTVRLSTAGDNRPTILDGGKQVCAGGAIGNFCAVAEFTTKVSTRNGGVK